MRRVAPVAGASSNAMTIGSALRRRAGGLLGRSVARARATVASIDAGARAGDATTTTTSLSRAKSSPAPRSAHHLHHHRRVDRVALLASPTRPHRGRGATIVATRGAFGGSASASGGKTSKAAKQRYLCQDCGEDYNQFHGQCPNCKAWESFKAFTIAPSGGGGKAPGGGAGARALASATETASSPVTTSNVLPASSRRRNAAAADDAFAASASRSGWVEASAAPRRLAAVLAPDATGKNVRGARLRVPTELGAEVERVLGGGIVPGALMLVGGDPGVGKSTLVLQIAGLLGERALKNANAAKEDAEDAEDAEDGTSTVIASASPPPPSVMYVSGEESVEQLAGRAERLGVHPDGLVVYSATRLEAILEAVVRERPAALVVDSIQTVFLEDATGSPGSVSQVRECATALLHAAKSAGMPTFIIGHVTKSGDIAGPRVLEHIVDVVLYLEGDADRAVRVLRGHKNRYGSTDEVGVFEMIDAGLRPVPSPSALFMGERVLTPDVSAAPTVTVQGSRPFMLEVQALCAERAGADDAENGGGGMMAPAVRTAVGIKPERMQARSVLLYPCTRFFFTHSVGSSTFDRVGSPSLPFN